MNNVHPIQKFKMDANGRFHPAYTAHPPHYTIISIQSIPADLPIMKAAQITNDVPVWYSQFDAPPIFEWQDFANARGAMTNHAKNIPLVRPINQAGYTQVPQPEALVQA